MRTGKFFDALCQGNLILDRVALDVDQERGRFAQTELTALLKLNYHCFMHPYPFL